MTPHLSRRTVIGAGAALGVTALPTLASAAPASDWVGSTLARMSLEQKVGQLFITYGYGPSATAPDERNQARYGVPTMAEVVTKYHLGGVIYFGWSDNVASPEQVHALSTGLQEAAQAGGLVPLQIATDQEMGIVTRIGPPATQLPGSMALGAAREPGLAMSAATITGRELRAMGVNVNFAPCSDVNVNPANPVIGVRSFSSRPDLVAELAAAQVAGYQAGGWVASSTKHFPGHGDTTVDSHTGLPVITHSRQEWEQTDLPPFRRAIAAKVDMVMTAHLLVPALDGSGDPGGGRRAPPVPSPPAALRSLPRRSRALPVPAVRTTVFGVKTVVLSGQTRYVDPWHPIAETSQALAGACRELGLEVEVRSDADPAGWADLSGVDLLVVNSGGGMPDQPPQADSVWQPVYQAVASYVSDGGRVLAVHTATNAFPEWPGWAEIIGGHWVRGESGHPRHSLAVFQPAEGAAGHPVFAGLPVIEDAAGPAVVAYDERYWRLSLSDRVTPLMRHESDGAWHVNGWCVGDRVLVDGLGHDLRSYASVTRRHYLANAVRWLLGLGD